MKLLLKYILYYVIGNIIFNLVSSFSQIIFLSYFGLNILSGFWNTYWNIYFETSKNFIIVYTIIFGILVIVDVLYKKYITQKLNENLQKIKRGDEDEK